MTVYEKKITGKEDMDTIYERTNRNFGAFGGRHAVWDLQLR
jgi:hypothetical protein